MNHHDPWLALHHVAFVLCYLLNMKYTVIYN